MSTQDEKVRKSLARQQSSIMQQTSKDGGAIVNIRATSKFSCQRKCDAISQSLSTKFVSGIRVSHTPIEQGLDEMWRCQVKLEILPDCLNQWRELCQLQAAARRLVVFLHRLDRTVAASLLQAAVRQRLLYRLAAEPHSQTAASKLQALVRSFLAVQAYSQLQGLAENAPPHNPKELQEFVDPIFIYIREAALQSATNPQYLNYKPASRSLNVSEVRILNAQYINTVAEQRKQARRKAASSTNQQSASGHLSGRPASRKQGRSSHSGSGNRSRQRTPKASVSPAGSRQRTPKLSVSPAASRQRTPKASRSPGSVSPSVGHSTTADAFNSVLVKDGSHSSAIEHVSSKNEASRDTDPHSHNSKGIVIAPSSPAAGSQGSKHATSSNVVNESHQVLPEHDARAVRFDQVTETSAPALLSPRGGFAHSLVDGLSGISGVNYEGLNDTSHSDSEHDNYSVEESCDDCSSTESHAEFGAATGTQRFLAASDHAERWKTAVLESAQELISSILREPNQDAVFLLDPDSKSPGQDTSSSTHAEPHHPPPDVKSECVDSASHPKSDNSAGTADENDWVVVVKNSSNASRLKLSTSEKQLAAVASTPEGKVGTHAISKLVPSLQSTFNSTISTHSHLKEGNVRSTMSPNEANRRLTEGSFPPLPSTRSNNHSRAPHTASTLRSRPVAVDSLRSIYTAGRSPPGKLRSKDSQKPSPRLRRLNTSEMDANGLSSHQASALAMSLTTGLPPAGDAHMLSPNHGLYVVGMSDGDPCGPPPVAPSSPSRGVATLWQVQGESPGAVEIEQRLKEGQLLNSARQQLASAQANLRRGQPRTALSSKVEENKVEPQGTLENSQEKVEDSLTGSAQVISSSDDQVASETKIDQANLSATSSTTEQESVAKSAEAGAALADQGVSQTEPSSASNNADGNTASEPAPLDTIMQSRKKRKSTSRRPKRSLTYAGVKGITPAQVFGGSGHKRSPRHHLGKIKHGHGDSKHPSGSQTERIHLRHEWGALSSTDSGVQSSATSQHQQQYHSMRGSAVTQAWSSKAGAQHKSDASSKFPKARASGSSRMPQANAGKFTLIIDPSVSINNLQLLRKASRMEYTDDRGFWVGEPNLDQICAEHEKKLLAELVRLNAAGHEAEHTMDRYQKQDTRAARTLDTVTLPSL